MSVINKDTQEAWQAIADEASKQRPSVGRLVEVVRGKHRGKRGRVLRHQVSKFVDPFRYGGAANQHAREMAGRFGYVCLVETDSGETFWVNADYTVVL